jgi:hypothetical protein
LLSIARERARRPCAKAVPLAGARVDKTVECCARDVDVAASRAGLDEFGEDLIPVWRYVVLEHWNCARERDCGNHHWYNEDGRTERCYHCEIGERPCSARHFREES